MQPHTRPYLKMSENKWQWNITSQLLIWELLHNLHYPPATFLICFKFIFAAPRCIRMEIKWMVIISCFYHFARLSSFQFFFASLLYLKLITWFWLWLPEWYMRAIVLCCYFFFKWSTNSYIHVAFTNERNERCSKLLCVCVWVCDVSWVELFWALIAYGFKSTCACCYHIIHNKFIYLITNASLECTRIPEGASTFNAFIISLKRGEVFYDIIIIIIIIIII